MSVRPNRRQFLQSAACATAGVAIASVEHPLAAPGDIRFGYAAITWDGHDRQAIDDISSVGFKAIQLRATVLPEFGDKPAALKELLAKRQLTLAAFSSGNIRIDPALEAEDIATHTRNARFVRDVGGSYLQLIDTRPKRALIAADYQRLGRLLTEMGKRTADIGIPLVYHHHMNSIGERPAEIEQVLAATDPRHVKLLFDTAHYQQGGGNPVQGIEQYADRIAVLHIKDLQSPLPGNTGDPMRSYRFVELGRGQVDLKAAFAEIDRIKFRGWAIVELDKVPDNARTPKESAVIAKQYLESLHFTL